MRHREPGRISVYPSVSNTGILYIVPEELVVGRGTFRRRSLRKEAFIRVPCPPDRLSTARERTDGWHTNGSPR